MEHADWPKLVLAEWETTYLTLHRFTQIVGKVALAHACYVNHWWHVALRVSPRGLTCTVPCDTRLLTLTLDMRDHRFVAETNERTESFALGPMAVADFYERVMAVLRDLRVAVRMWPVPVEVTDRTPFPEDRVHAAYDARSVEALHRVLLSVERVFELHRARFLGKCSPVHFFWGAFDLAVSRFSGRPNPTPPEDAVMREAYSHEVISHGFWPGGDWPGKTRVEEAVFYAYAVPEPAGFRVAHVRPAAARYSDDLGEYLLPYEAVRASADPAAALLEFMESTYLAGAIAAGWDVESLRAPPFRRGAARQAASAR
jgi:hypothetical protein